jgi:hypothetical protein
MRLEKPDVTITSNGGIFIVNNPTYYFLSDSTACKLYGEHAKTAARMGTQCVTLIRDHLPLKLRGIDWFPIMVQEGHPYEPFQLSGIWCAEHAARSGATRVVLVGMDGYDPDPQKQHYFFQSTIPDMGIHNIGHNRRIIHPKMNIVVPKYPEVQWVLYGEPMYSVEASNWTVRGA